MLKQAVRKRLIICYNGNQTGKSEDKTSNIQKQTVGGAGHITAAGP